MIFNSWLTTVSNRIRNASSRRRLGRRENRNRFANPAVMQAPPAFGRLSSHVHKAVWQTFDASPRWTSDSRRFQRQVWQTYDVAPLTEALEDRTLLAAITVDTTTDELDGTTTSIAALIATPGGTGISLREAITAANNTGGADIVNLPPGLYQLTLTGADENANVSGDLDILDTTTIQSTVVGVNAIIDGNGTDRVIHTPTGSATGSLTLNDITIQNGTSASTSAAQGFGGGGISHLEGALNLHRVIVQNNSVTGTTADGAGLNVDFDDTEENFAITITDSTFDNNTSGDRGGAIYVDDDGFAGGGAFTFTLINSTISNNTAVDDGGGIWLNVSDEEDTITITNSTISNNSVTTGDGGGFGNFSVSVLNIDNSTIADNTVETGRGGGLYVSSSTLTLNSSIVANNSVTTGTGGTAGGPDIYGLSGKNLAGMTVGILSTAGHKHRALNYCRTMAW